MGTGQYSAYFVERHLRKGSKLQNMLHSNLTSKMFTHFAQYWAS